MTDINALVAANAKRWSNMKLDPARVSAFNSIAARLCDPANKPRFQAVSNRLVTAGYQPVPWWFIAVCAEREYGGPPHWDKQLGQGDPLSQVSHNDPAGRGPFLQGPPPDDPWLRCALDALIDCGPHAALWHDWTAGGALTIWEEYNGLGYAARGVPSAYVWSGTDQYTSGKYVADHVYRNDVKDVQDGCAPILKAMMARDASIQFATAAGKVIVPTVSPVTPVQPSKPGVVVVPPVHVAQGGLVSELLDAFHRL
jgi:lysozyme family protein